ncbi:BBE domain-containing protein [Kitasatospora griseola]|uniref:BBE domain-containing protein n=1 Tax=Kitasatospora griseola TaxID=2064 RepID=UPI0038274CDF
MSRAPGRPPGALRASDHLIAAYTTGGAHLNFTDPDLRGCRAAHYGANYPRLVAAKHRHDPDGLFTFPQPVDS